MPASTRSLVVAGIAGIIALGMVFGASLWILAGIVGLMTIGLSWAMANHQHGAATVTRDHGDLTVKIGSQLPVNVRVDNPTRWPLLWILAEDIAPQLATQSSDTFASAVSLRGQRLGVFLIPAGGHRTLDYTVDCRRRGYLTLGPTMLETGDLLGMFRRFSVAGRPTYVTVLPTVVPINDYQLGSRRPIGEIRIRHRSMEDPTRIRGIRQWQIGDPMRSVHWAATARTGTLHTKIYEPSSILGATFILDMHTQSNPPANEPVRCDLAISAAASIAYYLLQQNEPFAMVTNARDAADRLRSPTPRSAEREATQAAAVSAKEFSRGQRRAASSAMDDASDRRRPIVIKPDKSPVHYQTMLQTLARLERSDALHLSELLIECESEIAGDTTMVIILQTASEETLAAIISAARRGRAVEVIANVHRSEDYAAIAGPLRAVMIDVHHLHDIDSIGDLCRTVAAR